MDKKKPSSGQNSRPLSKSSNTRGKSAKKSKVLKKQDNFVSKYPPIDYDKLLEVQEVLLQIKNDQNRSETFDLKVSINMTLRKVKEKINERYGNSLHQIKIYLFENSVKKNMEVFTYQTLKQLGLKAGDNINIYYEYEPEIHPLLESGWIN